MPFLFLIQRARQKLDLFELLGENPEHTLLWSLLHLQVPSTAQPPAERQLNPAWEENAKRDQMEADSGDPLILLQPEGRRVGISIPLSGLQGEEYITCDGNMKDDALFQQGARTALDLTCVTLLHKGWRRFGAQISAWGEDQPVPTCVCLTWS